MSANELNGEKDVDRMLDVARCCLVLTGGDFELDWIRDKMSVGEFFLTCAKNGIRVRLTYVPPGYVYMKEEDDYQKGE